MKSYNNGSQPSEDVARLAGVRFVSISEMSKDLVLDAVKVKAMTGNDKQGLQSFAQVVRKRPKRSGEKTTMLIGYRLISEFDTPLLT